ncbi:MAG: hypothetical protein Q8K82_24660 [Gemmatimonadaceae bacterium]|nr:hypothetical protein [Gemmatimonadaceae bacterium]
MIRIFHLGTLLATQTLLSCRDATPKPSDVLVRDSAGVEIVDNLSPAWTPSDQWTVAPSPRTTIGFDDATQTGPSDIVSAVRLSDGRVVLASAQALRLEVYSANGSLLRTIGRRGTGPGEFGAIRALWRYRGDSLLVFEGGMLRRFHLFDSEGAFGRTWLAFGADSATRFLIPIEPLPNGDIAVRTMNVIVPSMANRVERPLTQLVFFDPEWNIHRRLGRFPDTKRYIGPGRILGELFFSTDTKFAFSASRVYVGMADTSEVRMSSADDTLVRMIRWPARGDPVLPVHVTREQERRIAWARDLYYNMPDLQTKSIDNGLLPLFRRMPYPATFPEIGELLTDTEGCLWVLDFPRIGDEETQVNAPAVFDSTGRWLGRVRLPPRFLLLEVGRDHVLGIRRDSLDVQFVELYDLHRR